MWVKLVLQGQVVQLEQQDELVRRVGRVKQEQLEQPDELVRRVKLDRQALLEQLVQPVRKEQQEHKG